MERNDGKPKAGSLEVNARREPPRPYEPPRIEKKRTVSRATLFTGSGPSSGGIVSQ